MATEQYTLEQAEEEISRVHGEDDVLREAHTQDDISDAPNAPDEGHTMYAGSGHMKYVSGATGDGVLYNTGRNTNVATGSLNLTTSMQNVPGLSLTLGVGTYCIRGLVLINNPGTGSQGQLQFRMHGTGGLTCSNGRIAFTELFASAGVQGDYTNSPPLDYTINGSTPGTSGEDRRLYIDGIVVVSVAGTMSVQLTQGSTSACNTVQYGTFIESLPIT